MMDGRMMVAVAVNPDGTIAPHAGRALHWRLYDIWPGGRIRPVSTLSLDAHACLHEWHVCAQPERHPLHEVDVVIAASAGDGVIRRLGERHVRVITTAAPYPDRAVTEFLQGTLPAGLPHEDGACGRHAA